MIFIVWNNLNYISINSNHIFEIIIINVSIKFIDTPCDDRSSMERMCFDIPFVMCVYLFV